MAPRIIFMGDIRKEGQPYWLLNGALSSMEKYVNDFHADLHLFEYCSMQSSVLAVPSNAFNTWRLVAARDAVMAINHFMKELIAANDIANQLPLLIPHLDRSAMGRARAEFDESFPDYAKARHAVAHAGEVAKNADAFEQNSFSGTYKGEAFHIENGQILIQDALQGRTYTSTLDKKIVLTELSEKSLQKLHSVKNLFYAAFQKIPSPLTQPVPAS
jgi:hypothetical protein